MSRYVLCIQNTLSENSNNIFEDILKLMKNYIKIKSFKIIN